MQLENKNLCATCGECCKNSGCEFSATDFFKVDVQELQKYLDQGLISIACDVAMTTGGQIIATLFVKMRNAGQGPIDFLQIIPSPCHALKYNGCPFDFNHRPSGGKFLIPMKNKECYPLKNVSSSWRPYQNILRQLVIKYTGLTPEEKLRERIEDIFYQFFQLDGIDENFDYYMEFFGREINLFGQEVNFFERILLVYFKEEFSRAIKRCKDEKKLSRTNPLITIL